MVVVVVVVVVAVAVVVVIVVVVVVVVVVVAATTIFFDLRTGAYFWSSCQLSYIRCLEHPMQRASTAATLVTFGS